VTVVTASPAINGFKITFDGPKGNFTFSMLYADDNGTVHVPVNGYLGCLDQGAGGPTGKGCPSGSYCTSGECISCRSQCVGNSGEDCIMKFTGFHGNCYGGCCCNAEPYECWGP
jgi:hypothetical protein